MNWKRVGIALLLVSLGLALVVDNPNALSWVAGFLWGAGTLMIWPLPPADGGGE